MEIRDSNSEESLMKTTPLHPASASSTITLETLLTKERVAAQMGISIRTLEGLIANSEFPKGVRVGRFLYWTEVAINAWHQRVFAAQLAWRP